MRADVGERLSRARRAHIPKITQEGLDAMIGVKEGRTYSYEKGRALAPESFLRQAAKKLNTTFDYLRFGEADPSASEVQPGFAPPSPTDSIINSVPRIGRRQFPVLGSVGAASFPITSAEPGDWIDFSDDLYTSSYDRFALRVMGDSLEPRIMHGDYVLVHPAPNRTPGLIVVACNDEHEYVVKVLKAGTAGLELHAINEDYVPVPVGDGWELAGYIVGRKSTGRSGSYVEEGDNAGLRP